MDNQNPRVPILWEHSLTNLFGHDSTSDPGIALRQWVHFQGVHTILDLLSRVQAVSLKKKSFLRLNRPSCLVSSMLTSRLTWGKTIVRRHLANTDAQAVWKELSEHMRISSKGASEKRRLTQYVTNTVLDDSFKGTTEQFVLHFNEQFRQLEEIS